MPISFNNIPSGIKVPLFYAEVDNSAANTAVAVNKSLLIGQKLNTGTAQALTPVLCSSEGQAKELFGRGSQLARMVEHFRKNAPMEVLYCVALDDGEDDVAATSTVTFTGTASAAGTVYLYINGVQLKVVAAIGATAAQLATSLASIVNGKSDLPVTAAANSGVVTLTAKNKGAAGNDLKAVLNYAGVSAGEILPTGIGCTVSPFADGEGVPDIADAFAVLGDEAFEFIGVPFSDTASLNAMKDEMQDASGRWAYTKQLYGHCYTARRGTYSELAAYGVLRNDPHVTIVGIENNRMNDAAEVVGDFLGRTAVFVGNDPARPTQTGILYGLTPVKMQDRFNMVERQTLLTSGIATLTDSDSTRIERAVTTYQHNAFGDPDNSYYDSETLHTLAYVIRYLRSIITSKYARHKLANDGTRYGAGQAVVTPSVIRGEIIAAYRRLEYQAIVENAEIFAKYLIVERNANDPNRLDVLFPPDLVNQLRIFAMLVQFRLQYSDVEAE